jgi:hypothetical protein
MSWWGRLVRRHPAPQPTGPVDGPGMTVDTKAVRDHFASFVRSRRGVEAFVEPPTNVTASTVVLIAHDGEWTRRAVTSRDAAYELPRALGIPVYDVNQTGYPSRMREWNSKQRKGSGH